MKRKLSMSVGFALMALSLAPWASAADQAKIGEQAPNFTLQDQDGKDVSLSQFAGKVVVLEWTNPNCPYVQRHYAAKTMVNLDNAFSGRGVVWLAINSTHNADNAFNKAWVEKNNLPYAVLNDSSGKVGHMYGAKTTPDMFIIDKDGKLVYSGGIDNDPEGDKGAGRVNYVEKALDEVLTGQPVQTPQTKSYGCSVKYAS